MRGGDRVRFYSNFPAPKIHLLKCPRIEDNGIVQLLSPVWLSVTPWTAANFLVLHCLLVLLKLMSIDLVMPSNHLIHCLFPSAFNLSQHHGSNSHSGCFLTTLSEHLDTHPAPRSWLNARVNGKGQNGDNTEKSLWLKHDLNLCWPEQPALCIQKTWQSYVRPSSFLSNNATLVALTSPCQSDTCINEILVQPTHTDFKAHHINLDSRWILVALRRNCLKSENKNTWLMLKTSKDRKAKPVLWRRNWEY